MSLFRRLKNNKKPVIRQIIDLVPRNLFTQAIQRYQTDKYCSKYKTYDQFVALLFGQLCKCGTLEDISVGIGVAQTFIGDLGLSQSPAKSTMSDGNKKRDYQVFEHLYGELLKHYSRTLTAYADRMVIKEVEKFSIQIRDSSTISLCLSMFDWAKFRTAKGGIKIHTQWDEAMMLPNLVCIGEAAVHDSKGFEQGIFPKDTIIIEDKGYWDFRVMNDRMKAGNIFVTRIKENTVYEVIQELDLPDNSDEHILMDEYICLTGNKAREVGIEKHVLRRVVAYHEEKNTTIEIITNNLDWQAATVAALYRKRWNIETFFKLLKQNLNVKTFISTTPNGVKSQIFVALICYLLLEYLRRVKVKTRAAFSNFVEKIRICLCYYLTLDYVVEEIRPHARKARDNQVSVDFNSNTLF